MERICCSLIGRLYPPAVWPTLQRAGARLLHFNFPSLQDPTIQENGGISFYMDPGQPDLEARLMSIGQAIAVDKNFRIIFYPEQHPADLVVITGDRLPQDG